MTHLVESKFMHWITFICTSLLALSASILMFVYFTKFSLHRIFKTLQLVLCSLILAVSPWDKKIDELFKFKVWVGSNVGPLSAPLFSTEMLGSVVVYLAKRELYCRNSVWACTLSSGLHRSFHQQEQSV
ncbi:Hypothetical_protein [Hexamita inflata]|uniref:Hypothetical_protein n=1 Tax=Hexamita inflata TaxID=28002 RepID=A0ABP1IK46_9EUKA